MAGASIVLLILLVLVMVGLEVVVLNNILALRKEIRDRRSPEKNLPLSPDSKWTQALDPTERRIKYRAHTNLEGSLTVEGQRVPVEVRNLSKTGALISCPSLSLEVGHLHPCEICLGPEKRIQMVLRVVRVLSTPHEYGVSFRDLSIKHLQWISDVLSERAEQELAQGLEESSAQK